jgi:hypothetical protein
MSSERILMNDDLNYEEKEAATLTIDENKENEDDDFDFKVLLNAIIFPELHEKQKIHKLDDNAKLLIKNKEISRSTVNEFSKEMHNLFAGYK